MEPIRSIKRFDALVGELFSKRNGIELNPCEGRTCAGFVCEGVRALFAQHRITRARVQEDCNLVCHGS